MMKDCGMNDGLKAARESLFRCRTDEVQNPPGSMKPRRACHDLYAGGCEQSDYCEEILNVTRNVHTLLADKKGS